eukprot:m.54703 g.54703  ORF g.54703 m.54703 type:complete len:123 (+) comp48790_c0_seq1:1222-1590(+)
MRLFLRRKHLCESVLLRIREFKAHTGPAHEWTQQPLSNASLWLSLGHPPNRSINCTYCDGLPRIALAHPQKTGDKSVFGALASFARPVPPVSKAIDLGQKEVYQGDLLQKSQGNPLLLPLVL